MADAVGMTNRAQARAAELEAQAVRLLGAAMTAYLEPWESADPVRSEAMRCALALLRGDAHVREVWDMCDAQAAGEGRWEPATTASFPEPGDS
jgi:hypothetical protein